MTSVTMDMDVDNSGRCRRQVRFWLDTAIPEQKKLWDTLEGLKEGRMMTKVLRDGTTLHLALMEGAINQLFELHGWMRERIFDVLIQRVREEAAGTGTLVIDDGRPVRVVDSDSVQIHLDEDIYQSVEQEIATRLMQRLGAVFDSIVEKTASVVSKDVHMQIAGVQVAIEEILIEQSNIIEKNIANSERRLGNHVTKVVRRLEEQLTSERDEVHEHLYTVREEIGRLAPVQIGGDIAKGLGDTDTQVQQEMRRISEQIDWLVEIARDRGGLSIGGGVQSVPVNAMSQDLGDALDIDWDDEDIFSEVEGEGTEYTAKMEIADSGHGAERFVRSMSLFTGAITREVVTVQRDELADIVYENDEDTG